MAIDVKPILRAGVAAQAATLALQNVRVLKNKKPSSRRLLKAGVTNIVGIPLLRIQSQLIGQIV